MKTARRCFLLVIACAAMASAQTVIVRNPLPESRERETIEVTWTSLAPPGITSPVVHEHGQPLVSQILDKDGDGTPDLLLFQSSFGPRETKTFAIDSGEGAQNAGPTDARFELPRQDLAWENERIAFRMYGSTLAGDVNNGIDVWCKSVRYPIVEKWYAASAKAGKDTYHEDHGEGADFFSVGRSLGAGSCALLFGDTLMQPGLFTGHRVLAAGPVRAMFELKYDSARYRGRQYRVIKRISLDAGASLNRIEVVYAGFPSHQRLKVAAGLVRRANTSALSDPGGRWIVLWGPTNADSVNGALGTGVVMPGAARSVSRETAQHILLTAPVIPGATFVYHAGAAWTRAGDLATGVEWERLVAGAARRLNAPLVVRVKRRGK